MRRVQIMLTCLAIFSFGLFAVDAQGGSLADIITQQSASGSEFTILQQFIDASDSFTEQIEASGNYTFFAPTDRAFRNLEGAIDLSLADLLSDVDVVTALLQYHLVDGQLSSSQLRLRDGQVIPTELQNAFIGVTLSEDNAIVLNNIVEVTNIDIASSNGILHEINDVLLNRVVNDLIDERLRSAQLVTPTPEPTATPVSTPTEIPDERATARIRFGHFAVDAPDIQVLLDDTILQSRLEFNTLTEFEEIPQGIYTVTVVSLNADTEFVLSSNITLLNGDFLTISLIGEEDTIELITVTDDPSSIDEDEVRIVFLNALVDAPSSSIYLDGEGIIESVSSGEIERIDLDAFSGILSIAETRDSDNVYVEREAQDYVAQALYWVILFGTETSPEVLVVETSGNMQESLTMDDSAVTGENIDLQDGSMVDFLDNEPNFTILIQAVQVVDVDILNLLGNADAEAITFLAPSDAAFANLLSTIGYSESRLLSETDLLSDILRYHIIDEPLRAADFVAVSGTSIETILPQNQAFFVRATDAGQIFLNGTIEFERTDIQVSNGIIHVVDDVLLPLAVLEALDL